MNFRDMYMFILDKIDEPEDDRRILELVKTNINLAYLYVASFDHGVVEIEYELEEDERVLYLPVSFISMKKIIHPEKGVLSKEDYRIVNNRLILADYIEKKGELTVIMALEPDKLVEDTDVPEVNTKYHLAIIYYALFLFTDNPLYFDLFNQQAGGLIAKELEDDQEGGSIEYVKDTYYGKEKRGDW